MQRILNRRFKIIINFFYCNINSKFNLSNFLIYTLAFLTVNLIIAGGLYLSTTISGYNKQNIDTLLPKNKCECTCWDGFYRGIHGRGPSYKAFYFNYDFNFLKIFVILVLFVCLLYQVVLKAVNLLIYEIRWITLKITNKQSNGIKKSKFEHEDILMNLEMYPNTDFNINNIDLNNYHSLGIPILQTYHLRLRIVILIALGVSIYSDFYGVWCFINYLNDRDDRMHNSQLFYIITEMIPTYIYYELLDRYRTITVTHVDSNRKLFKFEHVFVYIPIALNYVWPLLTISILHMLLAMPEGMLQGLFQIQNEHRFLYIRAILFRDIGLILTDLIAIFIGLFILLKIYLQHKSKSTISTFKQSIIYSFDLKFWIIFSTVLYVVYKKYCVFQA